MVKSGKHMLADDNLTVNELYASIREIMSDNGYYTAHDISKVLKGRGLNISTMRVANNLRDMYDVVRVPEKHPKFGSLLRWRYTKKWK